MAKKGYFKREIESPLIVAQRNTIRSTSKQEEPKLYKIADVDNVLIETKRSIT